MYPLIPASGIPVGGPFGPASVPLIDATPFLVVLVALLVAGIVLALVMLRARTGLTVRDGAWDRPPLVGPRRWGTSRAGHRFACGR